jgi:CubicO group peptidase (beta-lactamase class C family)
LNFVRPDGPQDMGTGELRFRLGFLSLIAVTSMGMAADSPPPNPSSEAARVNQLFEKWDKPSSPGCSVAVMRDGRIDYEQGYGTADLDHDVKITPTTVFHVASMSKQFTAAAILMLAQEGKLSLDDPVRKYVPEVPDFGVPITLRQLLHHISGLRDQWELLSLAGWRYSQDLITDADILALVSRQKSLNFTPGSAFLYSNTGFTLLAQVVKRVSGQSFRDFTTARLFQPLGMAHTHFRDDHAEIVKNIAYGYRPEGDHFELSVTNFDTVGATSLLTTVEDLALWDENFYTARVGGEALIKALQERGRLSDGTELDYAAGLAIDAYRGLKIVEHAGADAGYRADMIRFPDQHFSVVALCNLASINPEGLVRQIADIYLAPMLGPAEASAGAIAMSPRPSPDRLQAIAGVYVDAADGDRVLRLHVEDGKLWGGSVKGKGHELEAITDDRFRYRTDSTELEVHGGDNGEPVRITGLVKGMKPHQFTRVSAYKPTIAELNQFTGAYRSDEIEALYSVIVLDENLVVHSLKTGNLILFPAAPDLFVGRDKRVRFVRDADGAVSGALLNTERTRNFRFERVMP